MPVGCYTKDEIRKIAEQIGLPVANKKDSQEICFVPDNDYARFIEENTEHKIEEGNYVLADRYGDRATQRNYPLYHWSEKRPESCNGTSRICHRDSSETNEVVIGKVRICSKEN